VPPGDIVWPKQRPRALSEDTTLASDCIDSQHRRPLLPALWSAGDEIAAPHQKRDPEIHQDVRAELALHQKPGGSSVEITVHCGVVHLTGLAESYAQKWAIDRAVRRIVGVKDLCDYLHVRPANAAAPDDHRIAQAANQALRWDARVPKGIRADVTRGVLRLRGAAERFCQREAAEEAVRYLIGVRDIVNEIALLPASLPADLTLQVEAALRRWLGPASRVISVAATHGVVTLRGVVPTFAIRGEIERAVWSIPGITRIDNQLQVA
jgi:osmotically-inducible protein OsmY